MIFSKRFGHICQDLNFCLGLHPASISDDEEGLEEDDDDDFEGDADLDDYTKVSANRTWLESVQPKPLFLCQRQE